MKISAAIITFNEESNIRAACESVSWADEIIVVDSESTDETRKIAAQCGARVFERQWPGFAEQKQFATDQAVNDWVFSLDADERVSPELRRSIDAIKNQSQKELADGYLIPRRSYYQGRWVRGGGWYPDRQLRLFNRTRAKWQKRHVHESVKMNEGTRVQNLPGDILHYTVNSAAEHHRMIGDRYASLAAQQMFEEGRHTSPLRIAVAAPSAFISSYLLRGGFRDGLAGLSIASFAAHHAFLKHLMLWELEQNRKT